VRVSVIVRQVLVLLVVVEKIGERWVVVSDQLVALPLGTELLSPLDVTEPGRRIWGPTERHHGIEIIASCQDDPFAL
jgi:hypothetical protein